MNNSFAFEVLKKTVTNDGNTNCLLYKTDQYSTSKEKNYNCVKIFPYFTCVFFLPTLVRLLVKYLAIQKNQRKIDSFFRI